VNLVLVLLLVTSGILAWSIRKDPSRPNIEILPEMVRSVPSDSFAPNTIFADGLTLQAAPAGVVARGDARPDRYDATAFDVEWAARTLRNPHSPDDPDALRRGARVFQSFCTPCHGPTGAGDGSIVGRGFPAPPSFRAEPTRDLADGAIFHIITHGKGNMPAHGAQIAEDDRWKVVLHVRTLMAN
jgi:mono/diheme cytochrome c family protein